MASIGNAVSDMITRLLGAGVQFAAVWNNQQQYLEDGSNYTFPLPAAFVETIMGNSGQIGLGVGAFDVTFRIHLLHEHYNTDNINGAIDQNTSVFDLRDQIIRNLNGYSPRGCSVLLRGSEQQDTDYNNVYHYTIDFQTHFIESVGSTYDGASGAYTIKEPPTDLQVNNA